MATIVPCRLQMADSTSLEICAAPPHIQFSEVPRFSAQKAAVPHLSVRLHGHLFSVEPVIKLYGSAFGTRVLDAFTLQYLHVSANSCERQFYALRRFLVSFAKMAAEETHTEGLLTRTFNALSRGLTLDAPIFADAVEVFCVKIRDTSDYTLIGTSNIRYRIAFIESLSAVIRRMAYEGLFPPIAPLVAPRKFATNVTPSLGELRGGLRNTEGKPTAGSYDAILSRSRDRMHRLRGHMESVLIEERALFDRGQELLAYTDPPIDSILAAVAQHPNGMPARQRQRHQQEWNRCFPEDNHEQRLSSLLRYLRHSQPRGFKYKKLPAAVQRASSSCGGVSFVRAHLEGRDRAAMAAWTIVAIDSGMNSQPLDDLASDPFIGRASKGIITIHTVGSVKKRAGYKPVTGVLSSDNDTDTSEEFGRLPLKGPPRSLSGKQAIEIWQRLSRPLRELCATNSPAEAQYLWIHRRASEIAVIERLPAPAWRRFWKRQIKALKGDPVLGGVHLQRRYIRVTYSHLKEFEGKGDARFVARLLQNTPQVSARIYLNRGYMRRRLDTLVREFQVLLEARLVSASTQSEQVLGISAAELQARKAKATETGLGFACADPWQSVQPGQAGKLCTALEACAGCPLLRFIPTPQSIRALVLFRISLERAQEEFFCSNPQRWLEVWQPGLALALAACDLLGQGAKARLLREAEAAVPGEIASGVLREFAPW